MNVVEMRKLDKAKIVEKLKETRIELANKRMEKHIGKENNTSIFMSLRKDIARYITILNEKEVLK